MKTFKTSPSSWLKMAEANEAYVFWMYCCVEAYETHRAKLDQMLPFASFIVAAEGFEERLKGLVEVIVNEINSEARSAITITEEFDRQKKINPLLVIALPVLTKDEFAQIECNREILVSHVRKLFALQLRRAEEINRRVRAITTRKK